MEEFFKEYKTKPSKDILEVMQTLHEEFDKTKKILIDLTFIMP